MEPRPVHWISIAISANADNSMEHLQNVLRIQLSIDGTYHKPAENCLLGLVGTLNLLLSQP